MVRRFTESIDLFPTLMDLLGAEAPDHLDGRSLVPDLTGPAETEAARPVGEAHFEFDFRDVERGVPQAALGLGLDQCGLAVIRDDRFKSLHFTGLPPVQFDLTADPGEAVNVAEDPAYLAIRLDYAERMLAWRARHLDRRLTGVTLTDRGVVNGRARAQGLAKTP